MKKPKNYLTFWKDIKFKYKLSVLNEDTLQEVIGIRMSKLNGLCLLMGILIFIFVVVSLIICFTPLRNYLPGYMNSEIRAEVVNNALRADSLQEILDRQNRFVTNIQDILQGKVNADTVQSIDSLTTLRDDSLMQETRREALFRRQFEESEGVSLTSAVENKISDTEGLIFYRPAKGAIIRNLDITKEHLGIDISSEKEESILATLDGAVVISTYTSDDGNVIEIQHSHDFISIYKHCGTLLKHSGETVSAGEVIALIGKDNSQTEPHLHFELWHKGHPVNPETYIIF